MRADKERLIIRSAVSGAILFIAAFLLKTAAEFWFPCSDYRFCLTTLWNGSFPPEAAVPVLSFFLGSIGWLPLNILPWFRQKRQIQRAIAEAADPLETMLARARDEELPVAITLLSGKVYIAKVTRPFNVATPTENLGLIPLSSGYRDSETHTLTLTINYSDVIEQITRRRDVAKLRIERFDQERSLILKNDINSVTTRLDKKIQVAMKRRDQLELQISMFLLVLPVPQIASVCFFDSEIHAEFFQTAIEINEEL
jgi:hypothetical protein